MGKNGNPSLKLEEQGQETRAFLRERYLYLLSTLCGTASQCDITMCENTNVTGQFRAFDINFENIIVDNLKTPTIQPIPRTILRSSDIVSMKFKKHVPK